MRCCIRFRFITSSDHFNLCSLHVFIWLKWPPELWNRKIINWSSVQRLTHSHFWNSWIWWSRMAFTSNVSYDQAWASFRPIFSGLRRFESRSYSRVAFLRNDVGQKDQEMLTFHDRQNSGIECSYSLCTMFKHAVGRSFDSTSIKLDITVAFTVK